MTDPLTRLRTALADRYRVERELGAGGMATVFLASDLRHDRAVAIKVLHPDLGAALGGERFLAEIKTTAKLQHPNILPLLDSGTADSLLYYVMPYVAGETLRARLERERQLPIDDALHIAREVADALSAAHALGIIHRDIKPENVLLQGRHALVADFGIALAVQQAGAERMTQTGLSLGTPQYMSPEQAMGERHIDARTDVYALGVVTYEMLTGTPPFTGATLQAVVAKVVGAEPESPRLVRKSISDGVEAAVLRALAKLPADRFASATEFAAALGTPGMPNVNPSPAPTARVARRMPRAWMAATAALALAGAAAGWAWGRRTAPEASARVSASVILPDSIPLLPSLTTAEGTSAMAISPDGSTLALAVGTPENAHLVIRSLGDFALRAMDGTKGAQAPFFSRDGSAVYFFGDDGFKRITLADGRVATLHTHSGSDIDREAWGGTILPDGTIALTVRLATEMLFLSPAGDSLRTLQCPSSCSFPFALPDGRVLSSGAGVIYIIDVTSGEGTPVVRKTTDGQRLRVYGVMPRMDTAGHLHWVANDGRMLSATFDADRGELTSAPEVVAEGVRVENSRGVAQFDVSANGVIAYAPGDVMARGILVGSDRAGRLDTLPLPADTYDGMELSPDGRRLAVLIDKGESSIVGVVDSGSNRLVPWLTGTRVRSVSWLADSRRLAVVRGDSVLVGDPGSSRPMVPLPQGTALGAIMLPLTDTSALLRIQSDTIALYRNGKQTGESVAIGGVGLYTATRDGRWLIGTGLGTNDRSSVVAHSLTGDHRRAILAPSSFSMGTTAGGNSEIIIAESQSSAAGAHEPAVQAFYAIAYDSLAANPFGPLRKLFSAVVADFPGRNYAVGDSGRRFVFKQPLRRTSLNEVRVITGGKSRRAMRLAP